MASTVLLVAGLLVVAVILADALMTTLVVSAGAGPLTGRLVGALWWALVRVHRRDREGGLLASVSGTTLLITTVLFWVSLLWAGWTLVFWASSSVVESQSREPAGLLDVVYFTGFCVFTLGTGDFAASSPVWRTVSAVASFSGLFLVTLAITYLVSVVAAVVQRRSLAVQVHALGESVTEIVTRGWRDRFAGAFTQQLVGLTPQVAHTAEQHLAYPVLHYFHSSTSRLAAPVAIASLDETLSVLRVAVAPDHRPSASAVEPLRYALERYLTTAIGDAWTPDVGAPPLPDLPALRRAGVPVVDDRDAADRWSDLADHRTSLHRLVANDGWSWQRV